MALALAVALGAGHIVARYAGVGWVAGVLKPLPIALLALLVATAGGGTYRWLVVAGLVLSLVGDVLLLFPTRFVAGLASFLTAHLAYIAAFSLDAGAHVALLVPFALVAALMLRVLWSHLGADRGPVLAYMAIIAVMGWRAAARAMSIAIPEPSGSLGLIGALVFMTSDSVLAVNRFAHPFAAADLVVMSTYYAAQVLIARSAIV